MTTARLIKCLALFLLGASLVPAQTPASLRGQVTDESGSLVPGAKITAILVGNTNPRVRRTATSDGQGRYSIEALPPGSYSVVASTDSLVLVEPAAITLTQAPAKLDLRLTIKAREDNVVVQDNAAPALSTDVASNASGSVLRGEALEALSDDPDDLQADLQGLAGPSAGPNGGAIYVDGFSGGEIPPKESIREIRINQDPYSPEYDKLGYGRIEILTKPGTNKYHGNMDYNLGTDWWNARNPYASEKAPLLLNEFEGGASGPLSKRASFTIDAQYNMVDNGSVVNAVTLDPVTLVIEPFNTIFTTIQRYTRISPRIDYQLNANNTLSVRYGITHGDIQGAGIGGFDLISRGYHTSFTTQTVQATETAILGATVNETRFQYYRNALEQTADNPTPFLQVQGSFNGGGSQLGHSADTQNSFEFQNSTSILHGAHSWKFGVRIRGLIDDSVSPVNFNGAYSFAGGIVPVLDANNQPTGAYGSVSSIERYQRTLLFEGMGYSPQQVRALGGGASQFSMSAGIPGLTASQVDAGLFIGDNWRVRPNLTISYGLRYEIQTNVSDWRDFAPRLSLAWSPGTSHKTVLRAGAGVFYDRFALTNTIAAERYNGITQQQYVLTNPDTFPYIPPPDLLAANQSPQSIQQIASDLRAPYLIQTAVTLERQLTSKSTFAITYTNSRGVHLLKSRDINAPLPGTYSPEIPGSGVYPDPSNPGPIFLTESSGTYRQNQMIANFNTRMGSRLNLFGFYVLNHAMSDTDGVTTSPANPYDFHGEYGPASTDIRNRVSFGGSFSARWNFRISPFVILQSGAPFNITSGSDPYGTTIYNARPAFASDPSKPGLIQTSYGLLDPHPTSGETILGRNYGRGPATFTVNLRVSKGFGFGPEKGGGSASNVPSLSSGQRQAAATGGMGLGRLFGTPTTSRKYNLIVSMSVRNLLNHNNPGPIIGNITSPLFGEANQIAGGPNGEGFSENASNRRLELQIRFSF